MPRNYTTAELEAFLDESLAPAEMAELESQLRSRPDLATQLAAVRRQRDVGEHSVGEIWRRRRVSCPSREQLGSFLLGALSDEQADYIRFHIHTVGCRVCQANFEDLQQQHAEQGEESTTRRRKYFQSSAGYLRR